MRMISRESSPSLIETPANPEAMPVAKGLIVEPQGADAAAEQDDRGAGQGVVPGRDHDRDDEGVEGQALLGHAVRRTRRGRRPIIRIGIIQRSRPLQPAHQPADSGLDRAGPHRDAQEAADHDDEQRDVDGAEQGAGVVVADVALGVLDPVEAVDRRGQRVDQDPLRGGRRPRGRCPGSARPPCRARRRRPG